LNIKAAKKTKLAKFMRQQSEKYNIPTKPYNEKQPKHSLFQNQYSSFKAALKDKEVNLYGGMEHSLIKEYNSGELYSVELNTTGGE